jgi:TonB family protein
MTRLLSVLLLVSSYSLSAQTRVRPMGDFSLASILLSFESTSSNAFAVAATQRGRGNAYCRVEPASFQTWFDSAEQSLTRQVDPPQERDRIEFTGPRLDAAGCGMRIDRTVTTRGSTYFFSWNDLGTAITLPQAQALLQKMKEVSRVTVELSPSVAARDTGGLPASPQAAGAALEQPYFAFQVEKQAAPMPGNVEPPYPDVLHSAKIEGEVVAQFVVDTTGRAEMNTFKVLKSSHDLFTSSVKSALPNMKFYPAQLAGRKVKQLVQMPFVFGLNK